MKSTRNRRKFLNNFFAGGIAAAFAFPKISQPNPKFSSEDLVNQLKYRKPYTEDYWTFVRQLFVLKKNRIYFNTASLGASPRIVVDKVYDCSLNLESKGEAGHHLVASSREKLAALMDCELSEIAITRNTTESMNIIASSLPLKRGDEVIITNQAHVGGAAPWLILQKRKGIKIKLINLDLTGKDNLEIIKNSISHRTKAISISHITCTTGLKLPIEDILEFCRKKNIYSCIDGAHALGMISISMKKLQPDFYATSGHKWLLGPKGTGFLYINKNIIQTLKPMYGGAFSDKKYDLDALVFNHHFSAYREEYGTRSTPLIKGIETSIDFINSIGIRTIEKRGQALATYLKKGLIEIPNVELLTPLALESSSAIVTFRIKNKNYKKVQIILGKFKMRVRSVHENNLDAIRISCAIYNNFEELDFLIARVREISNMKTLEEVDKK